MKLKKESGTNPVFVLQFLELRVPERRCTIALARKHVLLTFNDNPIPIYWRRPLPEQAVKLSSTTGEFAARRRLVLEVPVDAPPEKVRLKLRDEVPRPRTATEAPRRRGISRQPHSRRIGSGRPSNVCGAVGPEIPGAVNTALRVSVGRKSERDEPDHYILALPNPPIFPTSQLSSSLPPNDG